MPKKHVKRRQHEDKTGAAEKPTQKRALAEALCHLGPNATHSALARFVEGRFGIKLTYCILLPKARTSRNPPTQLALRARVA
jgi:hypothetical protein